MRVYRVMPYPEMPFLGDHNWKQPHPQAAPWPAQNCPPGSKAIVYDSGRLTLCVEDKTSTSEKPYHHDHVKSYQNQPISILAIIALAFFWMAIACFTIRFGRKVTK